MPEQSTHTINQDTPEIKQQVAAFRYCYDRAKCFYGWLWGLTLLLTVVSLTLQIQATKDYLLSLSFQGLVDAATFFIPLLQFCLLIMLRYRINYWSHQGATIQRKHDATLFKFIHPPSILEVSDADITCYAEQHTKQDKDKGGYHFESVIKVSESNRLMGGVLMLFSSITWELGQKKAQTAWMGRLGALVAILFLIAGSVLLPFTCATLFTYAAIFLPITALFIEDWLNVRSSQQIVKEARVAAYTLWEKLLSHKNWDTQECKQEVAQQFANWERYRQSNIPFPEYLYKKYRNKNNQVQVDLERERERFNKLVSTNLDQ